MLNPKDPNTDVKELIPFLSASFLLSGCMLKLLNRCEPSFVLGIAQESSFPTRFMKRPSLAHCAFLALLSEVNYHACTGLFLGSLFCSINPLICFYANTILLRLSWLWNIVWYQEIWYAQFCSSFSRFLWLFAVFCGSTQILGLFVPCKKCNEKYNRGGICKLISMVWTFFSMDFLTILILPNHQQRIYFH